MAKQPKRPAFTHCKVKQTSNVRAPWRVWFSVEKDGKPARVFRSFADEGAAYRFAEAKELEISNHGTRYGDIPPEVRRAFDFYRDESAALASQGADVPRFEDLVSGALKDIREAMTRTMEAVVPVAEAVEEFLAYKKSRVKERQIANLTDHLKRFAQDFGTTPVSAVSTLDVEKWLGSLRSRRNPDKLKKAPFLSALTRNHYRAALHGFFGYAANPARGLCATNPVSHLEPERVADSEPEAYSPADARTILQTALESMPHLVPVLALGFFAGLRISEAVNVDLAAISRGGDEFRTTGKTGPRLARLTTACSAWLAAQPRRTGPAWHKQARQLVDDMQELFRLAGVVQIHNGARHSFISYRCAETKDIAAVADECGNSVSTIRKHYRQLVTQAAAETYFAIRPAAVEANVTDIKTGRKSA